MEKPNPQAESKKVVKEADIPLYKLFSYSDFLDKILILIGLLSALASASLYPVIFLLYAFASIGSSWLAVLHYIQISLQSTVSATNKNYDDRMNTTIRYYVLCSFLALLVNYLSNVCFNSACERQIKRIRKALFVSILRQDMAFFDKNTPGELNSIIISNVETLRGVISFKFSDFITLMARGLACLTFALVLAWKFSIVFLGLMPFIIISLNMMIRMVIKYSIKEFQAYGSSGKIAQEALSSLRTILSFGLQKKALKLYKDNLREAEKMGIKKGFLKGFFEGAFNCLFNISFGVGILYATYLNRADCTNYSPGNLIPAFFCIVIATFAIGEAIPFISEISAAKGASKKIFKIIETESLVDIFNTKEKKIADLKGQIEFEGIHFNYPQRPEAKILQGLNLIVPAGKTVAFCGSSGCGKSTTFGLLQRFYLPSTGKIKIDGENIEELDLNWLRNQMGLVSQEPILFQTSIKENIRLGRLNATDAEIEQAARQANAHDFILETVNKYETQVGERGTQLSGGQKQRIAIARALLRNPRILLLDEATSALDNESEKIVQDALDKAKIGRTTLIIAHRLSTIRNADLIVGFDKGIVSEMGTHDQLMERKGIYYQLVTSQTKDSTTVETTEKNESIKQPTQTSSETKLKQASESKPQVRSSINKIQPVDLNEKKSKTKSDHKQTEGLFHYELKLWRVQKPETLWIILGTCSQLINGAVFPGIVLLFSQIYSLFSVADSTSQMNQSLTLMGYIMGIGVLSFVVCFSLNLSFAIAGAKLTKRIRALMFESMLRQEVSFHDLSENRSSILLGQLAANAPFCKGLTSDKLGLLAQGFSGVGLAIIISFVLNWKLAFVMLIFVPLTFGCGVIAGKTKTQVEVGGRSVEEEGGRLTTESVENIRTIVSLGRETYFIQEFDAAFDKEKLKKFAMFHLQGLFYSISNTIIFFVQLSAFSFGYYLVKYDNLSVTNLYRVYAAMTFSSMVLGRVYSQLPDQSKATQAAKTAFKIIDRKSLIDSMSEEGLRPDKVTGNIEFKKVCFEYSIRPGVQILYNFDLSVQNGQTNALVGPSGCGKSTTIALLLRFYDITSGSILFDGVDIRKLNIQWLRSQIGLVSQEPILFNYSIKENICNGDLSRENIPLEEIIEVAKQANINSRIENLPDKYETLVGNKGGQLSGGEKQRIAITRALIRKPKILLLDEATSALDNESEAVVQSALDNAKTGRTCIVIAHRLSTIQDANKITVLKAGSVIEEGSHAELMKIQGDYYKLQTQNKSLAN